MIGRIGDDYGAFLRAMDRIEAFSELSSAVPQHPLVISQLEAFRKAFECINCDPVRYLTVRLAVARMMNGCGHYADAKRLLRFLLEDARRVLACGGLCDADYAALEDLEVLLEGCFECAESGVVYLL